MRMEIPAKGAVHGHVVLHGTPSPDAVSALGFSANVMSSLLFQRLQPQGSHIIITIDEKEARADILCRKQDDGLPMLWDGKQAGVPQLQEIAERIRNKTFLLEKGVVPTKSPGPIPPNAPVAPSPPVEKEQQVSGPPSVAGKEPASARTEEEENYLVKQLHRVP
jgi:hypothetical protein